MTEAKILFEGGITCAPQFIGCETEPPNLGSVVMVRFELADKDNPVDKAIANLRSVVGAICDSRAMDATGDFGVLLAQAAKLKGSPANVGQWANKLASDVSDLKD
jgi:hypothetical protein